MFRGGKALRIAAAGPLRCATMVVMSVKPLSITNPSNFRDLAENVKSVPMRPHRLFRSDHLGDLDAHDAQQIRALGIRRVLDFRGVNERTSAECSVPGVQVHSLAIEPTIVQVLAELTGAGHRPGEAEVVHHMQETYRGFVRRSASKFAEFFALLLASREPTVFHCTAGKDRTGWASALLLHVAGVDDETILTDYLLTNDFSSGTRDKYLGLVEEHLGADKVDVYERVMVADADYLQTAYDTATASYGGVDGYLRDGLGLDDATLSRLREKLRG
jgi:protein-tyrosine phosphatase